MRISKHHITKNPVVLVSVIMAIIGWLLAFVGGCIIGKAGLLWWVIIYELLLLGSIFFTIFRNVFHQYQIMLLVFLGISISMLTTTISGLIYGDAGPQVASAGAVILIIMQFFWVILYGSTEDSAVYQGIYSTRIAHVSPNVNIGLHAAPKESKVALSSPEASGHYQHQSVSSVNHAQPPPVTTPIASPTAPPSSMPQPQKSMATALHPYTANPEDPNELSFGKDEVLEILNTSGNWWQAKKQDGTIGIVPSNYFAQP